MPSQSSDKKVAKVADAVPSQSSNEKVAKVELGQISEQFKEMIELSRQLGREITLKRDGSPEDETMLEMWKFRSNWIPEEALGKTVVVKAQIPLDADPLLNESMLYDEKRSFTLNVCKTNCKQYAEFVEFIQENGENGNKAYITATLPDDAKGELHLNLDESVDPCKW